MYVHCGFFLGGGGLTAAAIDVGCLVAGPRQAASATSSRTSTTSPTRSASLETWGQGMYQQLSSAATERG